MQRTTDGIQRNLLMRSICPLNKKHTWILALGSWTRDPWSLGWNAQLMLEYYSRYSNNFNVKVKATLRAGYAKDDGAMEDDARATM
jgi:hypothetical protein